VNTVFRRDSFPATTVNTFARDTPDRPSRADRPVPRV